jgi:mono/diheme cytochrome c family protein
MKKIIYFSFLIFAALFLYTSCSDNTFAQGKERYEQLCANCHGNNGEGLGGLIPPLAKSDYLKNNKEMLACIIKNGLQGEIIVNGKSYNQGMPATLSQNLTPADITNISNYVLSSWENQYGALTLDDVQKQLNGCKRE